MDIALSSSSVSIWNTISNWMRDISSASVIILQMMHSYQINVFLAQMLNHWGRVTHICVNKLTIIGSDNGLPPGRHQAIIWTNAGISLIGPLGTNFSEILIES